jgi:DNA polymerase elongation subunit (family B)
MSQFYTHFTTKGNNILYIGRENGRKFIRKVPYKPSLFIESKSPTKYISHDQTKWLSRIKFDSISDAREYIKLYDGIDGHEIYGMRNFEYAFISDQYPNDIDYDLSFVKILYFDIETKCESGFPSMETFDQPVIAITCQVGSKYTVFGLGDFTNNSSDNITYIKCGSESELLIKFVDYIKVESPDILSGYNIAFFDIPYLIGRMDRVIERDYAKRISPWHDMRSRVMTINQKTYTVYDFLGLVTLDYMEVYKKFSSGRPENYKLDTLAKEELGESKVQFDGNLRTLYTTDWQKFIEYNIHDVRIVSRLEEKLKLIEMILTIAFDAKVNFMDVFKQVRLWDIIIFNHLKKIKGVIPPKSESDKDVQYAGAAVKDPIVGKHNWLVSFDVNSLYPMLIVQYNISPEKLIKSKRIDLNVDELLSNSLELEYLKNDNLSLCANGHFFNRDSQGFLPNIMERMYEDRKKYKNEMSKYKSELEQVKKELKSRGIDI